MGKALGAQRWLQAQFEALAAQVRAAGLPVRFVEVDFAEPAPRSWAAQRRAVRRAVQQALARERALAASPSPAAPEQARLQ